MPIYIKHAVKCLLLAATLILIQIAVTTISPPSNADIFQSFEPSFSAFVIMSLIEAMIVYLFLTRIHITDQPYATLKKISVVFVMYWGTKYLQMQIEALFFLNLWQTDPVMDISLLAYNLWSGLLISVIFCSIAGRIVGNNQTITQTYMTRFPQPLTIIKVATIFTLLYLSAGSLLVALADSEAFNHTYGDLTRPIWMPAFQFLRGLLWAAIAWWALRFHNTHFDSRITLSLCLSLLPAAQLLPPNPLMPDQLRYAHMLEMTSSMFIFGWFAARLLSKHHTNPSREALTKG
jgi:type III secretory pathway component EscS